MKKLISIFLLVALSLSGCSSSGSGSKEETQSSPSTQSSNLTESSAQESDEKDIPNKKEAPSIADAQSASPTEPAVLRPENADIPDSKITFRNLNFENSNGLTYSESDDSLYIEIGNDRLLVYASETSEGLASTYITLQNSAAKSSYSNISNEKSFTQTIAGFKANGINFAASNGTTQNVVYVMSFFDGEYVYTISFASALGADDFTSNMDTFLQLVESTTYTKK